jgi:hypothetical protein
MSKKEALQEYANTKDILLLQKKLGHKHIKSTVNFLRRNGVF